MQAPQGDFYCTDDQGPLKGNSCLLKMLEKASSSSWLLNSKTVHPNTAFLCQNSTGWRTNFTYYSFNICLTIICWASNLCQAPYTCSNEGLSNTEPHNYEDESKPFNHVAERRENMSRAEEKREKREQNHVCPGLSPKLTNLRVCPLLLRRIVRRALKSLVCRDPSTWKESTCVGSISLPPQWWHLNWVLKEE